MVKTYHYDPFGAVRAEAGTANNDYKFQTEQFDSETGLVYLRARYYDPNFQRFISKDPVKGDRTVPQSMNNYQYAYNNPINLSDPSGEAVGGVCGSANLGLGAFGTCSVCLVGTSNRELGFLLILGGGGTTGLATGIGVSGLWSPTTNNLNQMKGQDVFVGLSGELIL